jgi:hypothetical protein
MDTYAVGAENSRNHEKTHHGFYLNIHTHHICGYVIRGGVSNLDINGNNALPIKAIGIFISTLAIPSRPAMLA